MQIDDARRLARAALSRFALDPASRLEFVKYRENHVFRAIDSSGASVAIRLHRPGYRDDAQVRAELSYLRELRDAGIPVPEVVTTPDGDLFADVESGGHRRLVSVQRWVDDAAPFGDVESVLAGRHSPEPEAFARIGKLLGRLHAAADRIGVPADFQRSAWNADGLVGAAPLWGDPLALPTLSGAERAAITHATPVLHARLTALGTDRRIFGVVHADATPENILESDGRFVLIDFDDFGTGWYVFDLVTAVFHHALHPRYPAYERALRDGYTTSRPLDADVIDRWDDFMLARGLTYLGWAAARPGDPASEFIAGNVAPWVASLAGSYAHGEPAPWRTDPARPASKDHR